MKEYHKIETLFERDMEGSKKLIEGRFRNECVEYLKDNKWIFTEKIDGTNIRVHWDGHKVTYGGRTDNANLPGGVVQRLNELFSGETNAQIFEQKFGETEVTFYGEGYGGKIQGGGAYKKEQEFILFDVMVGETFLARENIEDIAQSFSLQVVPIVITGTLQEAIDYVKSKPKSTIALEEKESEGLVGVPMARLTDFRGNRVIVKIKVCDFN
jgi:hypothetical protein